MATFDVVSKVDHQSLDNAVNNARKEIINRYDFRDTKTEIDLNKKDLKIHILTENSLRMKAISDVLLSRMMKQGIDPTCLDTTAEEYASGSMVKKDIMIREGLDKETAKKVVALIKDSKLKVQASIMDDHVRVQGKQIDDLQEVIALLRKDIEKIGQPLQYLNMKA
jgi:cyclic-di-GMP-binding protein